VTLPALALLVVSAQARPHEDDRLVTRRGAMILEKIDTGAQTTWRVRFKDRTLVESDSDELGLWELFEGDAGYDYVIVKRSSGGIACPYMFRVVEVSPRGATGVSEEFGSCVDPSRTRLYGSALVLEMPAYTPHPELLTPREVRERQQTTEIFTVTHGRIAKRRELRR
jgi:hypothetical protein